MVALTRSVGLVLLAVAACSEADPDDGSIDGFGGESWTSEHFTYRSQPDDPFVCPEVLAGLESAAGLTYDALGIDRSRWDETTYYKFPEPRAAELGWPCDERALGCARAERIVAVHPFNLHELVHNVHAKTSGVDVPLLLAEGVATAFSCDGELSGGSDDWDWRTFEYDGNGDMLPMAGRLVLGLSTLIGAPAIAKALDSLDEHHDALEVHSWLQRRHGVGLDAAWEAAVAKGLGACLPLYGCGGQELPAGLAELSAGCHGFDARTLPQGPGEVWTVNATGHHLVIMPCDVTGSVLPLVAFPLTRTDGKQLVLELPAVAHAALFASYPTALGYEQRATVDLSRVSAAPGTSCDAAPALTTAPGRGLAIAISTPGIRHYRIAVDDAASVRLRWGRRASADVTLAWCADCAAVSAGDCASIELGTGVSSPLEAGTSNILVVTASPLPRAAVLELSPEAPR